MSKQKRNAFQRAEDKRFAVELLGKGYTYQQIAKKISDKNPYTISYQQVIKDLDGLRMEAIAEAGLSMLELIDEEMQQLETILVLAWAAIRAPRELIKTTEIGDSKKTGKYTKIRQHWINLTVNISALKIVLDATARRSTLRGVDSYLKHLDTNIAIESLVAKGYIVSMPEGEDLTDIK
jgi:hypothetical protein